jgi:hypothetical protein
MQDRVNVQNIFRPQAGDGGRATVGVASARIGPLDLHKEYHFFVTKLTWIAIGDVTVTATTSDFPLSAGGVYRHTPTGNDDRYIAYIEDPSVTATTGYIFYGRSEA